MSQHRLEDKQGKKETFLKQYGTHVSNAMDWSQVPSDYVVIIWIKNRDDTVALILFNRRDFNQSQCSTDKRERKTYLVAIKDLVSRVDRECAEDLRRLLAASEI